MSAARGAWSGQRTVPETVGVVAPEGDVALVATLEV